MIETLTEPRVDLAVATMLRHQEIARYPALFCAEPESRPGFQRIVRPGTGLVVVSAAHTLLHPEEAEAIAEYRLQQYVLAGLYDIAVVERLALRVDPAMQTLSGADIHVAIGNTAGQFLCYLCFQSALEDSGPNRRRYTEGDQRRRRYPVYPRIGDAERPIFPSESEYGRDVFGAHPGLKLLPVAGVRELMRLVRNQAIRTHTDGLAVVEAIVASSRIVRDRGNRIEATVGCAGPEARRLFYGLAIPMVYAPTARIVGENITGSVGDDTLLWTPSSAEPGRFWPFALSTADVIRDSAYYDMLDTALSLPYNEALRCLKHLRRRGPIRPPRLLVADHESGGTIWTVDPIPRTRIV
jgi:hypothetical protein